MAGRTHSGLIDLDRDKLERALLRNGLSKTALADAADVTRATVLKAFRGEGIYRSTAAAIAKQLGYADANELLASPGDSASTDLDESEWEVDEYLGPWITTSNSLQFRVCRMRHRFLEGRLGRGKCYDLLNPSTRERDRIRELLLRHPTVCARVESHPLIANNLAAFPGRAGDVWWVVDRWLDAETLEDEFESRRWNPQNAPQLAMDLAQGLAVLHAAGIVFRELSPRRVLISEEDGRAILTDFELAKLLEPAPTVSAEWPEDAYRASEVEGGQADQRADLFSWAMVVCQAFTGELGAMNDKPSSLSKLPKAVRSILEPCLSPAPSDRPKDTQEVLSALSRAWPKLAKERIA